MRKAWMALGIGLFVVACDGALLPRDNPLDPEVPSPVTMEVEPLEDFQFRVTANLNGLERHPLLAGETFILNRQILSFFCDEYGTPPHCGEPQRIWGGQDLATGTVEHSDSPLIVSGGVSRKLVYEIATPTRVWATVELSLADDLDDDGYLHDDCNDLDPLVGECSPGGRCNVSLGICECSERFTGANCDECADARFGAPDCVQCSERFSGPGCNQCSERFSGPGCSQCSARFTGESCDKCADERFTGESCDKCADERFTGASCEECADARFIGASCDKCADERFTGASCEECADERFTGASCEECADARFTGASCEECSNVRFSGVSCDECADIRFTGAECTKCVDARFTGASCDECANTRFSGPSCDECADVRFTGVTCDECAERFTGSSCEECADARFTGSSCEECADARFTGTNCDKCAGGRFKGANCDQCVDDRFTGTNCDQCADIRFTGAYCDECAPGMGGEDCSVYQWANWPMPNPPGEGPNTQSYAVDTEIVHDNVTGLSWQRVVPSQTFTPGEAESYCAGLQIDGFSGWRLPSRIELFSLIDFTRTSPAIDIEVFPGTPSFLFWSASRHADLNLRSWAWGVSFDYGISDLLPGSRSDLHARCVR